MQRHSFTHDGLTFSWLDSGGSGKVVLALHGHWMGATDFDSIARAIGPEWRIIALDQRSFGETDHTERHSIKAYVGDIVALLDHLGVKGPVPIIGHSFGGMVAYLLAAAKPDRVAGIVVVDIGVVIDDDCAFVRKWGGVHAMREELEDKIGERLVPYLQKSIHRVENGWSLNFDPEEFLLSEHALNGDHWGTWLSSDCPALVIRGENSPISDEGHLKEMVSKRENTEFATIPAGHSVHIDNPDEFARVVRNFLNRTC